VQDHSWPSLTGDLPADLHVGSHDVAFLPGDGSPCGITGDGVDRARLVRSGGATLGAETRTRVGTPACPKPRRAPSRLAER
jgi:hypothetical protein